MNASVLWDLVSRAKIECHEAEAVVFIDLVINIHREFVHALVVST